MRLTIAKLAAATLLLAAAPSPAVAAAAAPTAAQLKAAVAKCTKQISNGKFGHDAGGTRTVPVCATGNAVHWRADMDIVCDGQPTAKCNKSTDPWFQAQTAWNQSDGKPLIADKLPFVVVPGVSSTWNHKGANITGGTVAAVVHKDKLAFAVVGDVGPTSAIGEGSYRLAELLGINPNPKNGGVSGAVVDYILFPGIKASPIESNASAVSRGTAAATELVSGRKGCAIAKIDFAAYPDLTAGATGDAVKAAQCVLRANGFSTGEGDPTGALDAATTAAVSKFQTAKGLTATGTVDVKTWTALLSAGSTPQVQDGSSGDAVSRVQRALNAAVAAKLNIDGQFGANTTAAVQRYQSARGLGADGIVGANTWKALQSGR
ncbi:peptidoglycan-binding protein [Allokutzneria sp. NRRL B-24872]|uniref:peptidoglycan-binding protein n=1 Tax=Allokutzneria sp. NRRL B-24872 TaxID=1137961 RepID=UPI001FEFCE69|nr:peptidoglycan-binding protein [Allokutzneria sp. NRRL B-24872]